MTTESKVHCVIRKEQMKFSIVPLRERREAAPGVQAGVGKGTGPCSHAYGWSALGFRIPMPRLQRLRARLRST